MSTSYIEEVRERALELVELVERKSSGRAILLPVTKGFGVREVEAMLEVGLAAVGESYAQEMLGKAELVNDSRVCWHMFG